MRIIIDGCDKSGKSTLIEALKNQVPSLIGLKLLTKPKDSSEMSKQYVKMMYAKMADMSRDQGAHYLFDRWYPSEMVYSFKRGYNAIQDGWFYKFEQELSKTPNLYILVEAPKKVIAERFKADGENFAKVEEIDRIQKRYRKQYDKCQLNKMIIDTTGNLDGAVEQIKAVIEQILTVTTNDFTDSKFKSTVEPLAEHDDDPVTEGEKMMQENAIAKEAENAKSNKEKTDKEG